ncbi:MAG: YebC/PmpR family DNA-binding transcriptional regulator [Gammaproteobacteria bacterium]|nr:YebC/PmpR family DNA-binding transcriptional regulator [Gammaproteobacteria bacterium]
MAGHSKWANIQHRKNAQDARRGKLFTKLIREITVSAGMGGGDPSTNPRLRAAIDKALTNNMTRDTIDRAIKRGAGGLEGKDLETVRYEGYGPGGVAILVETLTNNRNRTVGEVRHAFTKCGGNLGTDGSVAYLFTRCGTLTFEPGAPAERILEIALEAGAQDMREHEDGSMDVVVEPAQFDAVKTAFEKAKLAFVQAEITMLPATEAILDEETEEKVVKLVDMLEDLDDVQEVYRT